MTALYLRCQIHCSQVILDLHILLYFYGTALNFLRKKKNMLQPANFIPLHLIGTFLGKGGQLYSEIFQLDLASFEKTFKG